MRLPFAISGYQHRSLPVSAQRVVNLFSEAQPETAKSRVVLLPTPGLVQFSTGPFAGCRGLHVMGDHLYAVIGIGVFRVTDGGSSALLGTIPGGGPVSMDSDSAKLVIVVPETREGYVVDRASGSVTQIVDPDFGGATAVTVIDGYFVFASPNSTEFFHSAISDPTSYNAFDFASAEWQPDNLVTLARVGGELWLFGERSIEIWTNIGAVDFPFLRSSGGLVARGTVAPASVAVRSNTATWLGDDLVVYTAAGAQPQRISTHAIEQAINGYSVVSDAEGWVYEQEGHAFYVLTFPAAEATWCYDFATGLWHERNSVGVGYWRAAWATPFAGHVIAGDASTGKLWRVEPAMPAEDGETIIRLATSAAFQAEARETFFSRLALEFQAGVGLTTGQGAAPVAWVSWSNDGGHTWSNPATVRLGAIGAYRARAELRRLGKARDRVFRVQWSDPVFTVLAAMDLDAEASDG